MGCSESSQVALFKDYRGTEEKDIEEAGPGEVIEEYSVEPKEMQRTRMGKLEDGVTVEVQDGSCKSPKKVIDPKLPTRYEVEEHEVLGHSVYRNWCGVCVCEGMGTGRSSY